MKDRNEVIKGLEKVWDAFNHMEHELYADYVFDALALLKEQEASEWVSVKDRLPEKLTLVLVCNHGIYDIAFVGDKGNWVNKLFEPEYWMPLPKPPKGVSE